MKYSCILVKKNQVTSGDSHFIMAEQAAARGSNVFIGDLRKNKLYIKQYDCLFSANTYDEFFLSHWAPASEFDLTKCNVMLRIDPPIDVDDYVTLRSIFEESQFVNRMDNVMFLQSKIALITMFGGNAYFLLSSEDDLHKTINRHRQFIIKPLIGKGGGGVLRYTDGSFSDGTGSEVSINAIKRTICDNGLLGMTFYSEIQYGESRAFVVDGKIVGGVIRVPSSDSWLANSAYGAKVSLVEFSEHENKFLHKCINLMAKFALRFYVIDFILTSDGPIVIEINVCNPGGLKFLAAQGKWEAVHRVAAIM